MPKLLLPLLLAVCAGTSEVSAQAATPAAVPTLQLLAPVGSSAQLQSITTVQMSMTDIQVSAAPGSQATQAQLNEARRQVGTPPSFPVQTVTGKQFYKVTERDAAGNVTLLLTTVQNVPAAGQPAVGNKAASTPKAGTAPITMRMTQQITPAGKTSILKMESDNPQVNAMFAKLTPEALQKMSSQNSTSGQAAYGTVLQVGQSQTATATLDAQTLFGTIFSAIAGPQGQNLFSSVKSTPLTTTTTTTYRGLNAQGQHVLDSTTSFGAWTMSVNVPDEQGVPTMTIKLELLNTSGQAQNLYRKDGLSAGGSAAQTMKFRMTMTTKGIQTSMVMNMQTKTTLSAQ